MVGVEKFWEGHSFEVTNHRRLFAEEAANQKKPVVLDQPEL
jgi:hypothetical protein